MESISEPPEQLNELEELPEIPGPPPSPADPFASTDLGAPLSADEMSKMGRGTPIWAWGAFVVLVVGVAGVGLAWFQQSQRYEQRWDEYNAAQEAASDQGDFLQRIRALLPETQHEDVKLRILEKMAEYRDAASVPVIAAQLSSEIPTVRTAAARALAAIGSPSADAAKPDLLRVLPDTSPQNRAAVVWALAVLGEASASDAIIEEFAEGRLQGQPEFDPAVISSVLGPTRLASNDLMNHDETSVRTLTAAALAETATPEVIEPLSQMATFELARDEPDENVLRSIASGLGRAGDPRAGAPLFRMMESQPRLRTGVLDSLRKTVGAPGIAALLSSTQDVSIQRELVRMLAASHDPRAADPLAQFVDSEDTDMQQDAAFGLADLGDPRAAPRLVALAEGGNLTVGREALSKLQALGVPDAAPGLIAMLDDERFLGRRANILRALGTTGAPEAGAAIEGQLDGDDVASAAAALADLDYEPAYEGLARMVPRPRNVDFSQPLVSNETAFMNRTAAVRAMGRYGRVEAAPALMTIVEDPMDDRRLRQDAGLALGAVADEEVLREVIAKLRQPELDEVAKRYYVSALWQNPTAQVAGDLMELVATPGIAPDVKRAAALAIGYAADPSLDPRIASMLDDEANAREAAFMIVLGGSDTNARALLTKLGGSAELQEVLRFTMRDDSSNVFNLVTGRGFESGAVWRRLSVAHILNEGEGDNRHGYVWNHLVDRLSAGWAGHDGLTPREIRQLLWEALRGEDEHRRELVAEVFAAMDERGLLMAARDMEGPGSVEAHRQLREMNNPAARDQ